MESIEGPFQRVPFGVRGDPTSPRILGAPLEELGKTFTQPDVGTHIPPIQVKLVHQKCLIASGDDPSGYVHGLPNHRLQPGSNGRLITANSPSAASFRHGSVYSLLVDWVCPSCRSYSIMGYHTSTALPKLTATHHLLRPGGGGDCFANVNRYYMEAKLPCFDLSVGVGFFRIAPRDLKQRQNYFTEKLKQLTVPSELFEGVLVVIDYGIIKGLGVYVNDRQVLHVNSLQPILSRVEVLKRKEFSFTAHVLKTHLDYLSN